jgi:hypothetical protein
MANMEKRVYVLNEPRIFEELEKNRIHAAFVEDREEWETAKKHALVMVVNPSTQNIEHMNPMICLDEYRELVRGIIIEKEPPPVPGRPWQPATMIRCNPDAAEHTRTEKLALFTKRLLHLSQKIHTEGFSVDATLAHVSQTVRSALVRKLKTERKGIRDHKEIILACRFCAREPYLKSILKRGE